MLPSPFIKFVGICLIAFGLYDTRVYWYALTKSRGEFDFFGKLLPASHLAVRAGFSAVLAFYYLVGAALIAFE